MSRIKQIFSEKCMFGALLSLLFIIYFCTAEGLMNSSDAPNYFTSEAIIRRGSIDMNQGGMTNPHFGFASMDSVSIDKGLYSVRGWIVSFASVPIHLLARIAEPLMNTAGFPTEATSSYSFPHELATTALISIFTVLALGLLWKLMRELGCRASACTGACLALGLGTLYWKYSIHLNRGGFLAAAIAIFLLADWRSTRDRKSKWSRIVWITAAIIAQVDPFQAIVIAVWLGIRILENLYKNGTYALRRQLWAAVPGTGVFIVLCAINLFFYKTALPFLYRLSPDWDAIVQERGRFFWCANSVFTNLPVALFNLGGLPPESLKASEGLVQNWFQDSWARKAEFLGIFIISPVLLPAILAPYLKGILPERRRFYAMCVGAWLLSTALTSKLVYFYAANQFDLRYFYPAFTFLGPPLAGTLEWIINSARSLWIKFSGILLFLALLTISLIANWAEVLRQYPPAQTGGNKIPAVSIVNLNAVRNFSFAELWNATFMNWRNLPIGLLFLAATIAFFKIRSRKQQSSC